MKALPVTQVVAAKKILYIDPHPACREMLTQWLSAMNYAISAAASIADGLRLFKREFFDLIIIETEYANGTVEELYHWIRSQNADIPIIFFSSAGYDSRFIETAVSGPQSYLTKPLGFYTMTQTIAELLARSPKARSTHS